VFVAATMTALVACSKKDDSGAPSGVPPLTQGAPAPAIPPPPPVPQAPPPLPPPSPPPPAPERAAAPAGEGGSITGKIEIAPALAKKKPEGTLFLVARRPSDNPSARGTLIAVKKLPATKFPLPFDLSGAEMPFQQGAFEGDVVLTARIDQDGDPLTHQKGDVFGMLPKVRVGSKNVRVTLDQFQKEDESLAGGGPMGGGRPPVMPPGHPGMGMPPGHP
jgi:cytochrome c-type biogenesis protein CcmH